jgi:molybdenum cofactor cytidylyltransferase
MTALIILAAGESSRLGQPKQNLVFQNQTLLERAIETGLASNCKPATVVLGGNSDLINLKIRHEDLNIIHNPNWTGGMASSIRIAINGIENDDMVSSVIIMLCDQPFVTSALIENLRQKQIETGKSIIACSYQDTVGVPALFDRSLFGELRALTGNEGAKKIIREHPQDVATIPFEKGSIDIDTQEDYERLINSGK